MTLHRTDNLHRHLRRAGFTLMEMLVVVAIIVALAGMGGYFFMGALNDSKVSTAQVQATTISQAIDRYQVDHAGIFPPNLETLLQRDADGKGPYLKTTDAILDPWGRQYQYDPTGPQNAAHGAVVTIPDVFCLTPDGKTVGNWKEKKMAQQ